MIPPTDEILGSQARFLEGCHYTHEYATELENFLTSFPH
jgi:hypothetical protein